MKESSISLLEADIPRMHIEQDDPMTSQGRQHSWTVMAPNLPNARFLQPHIGITSRSLELFLKIGGFDRYEAGKIVAFNLVSHTVLTATQKARRTKIPPTCRR